LMPARANSTLKLQFDCGQNRHDGKSRKPSRQSFCVGDTVRIAFRRRLPPISPPTVSGDDIRRCLGRRDQSLPQ
jgi:hypothetical protein